MSIIKPTYEELENRIAELEKKNELLRINNELQNSEKYRTELLLLNSIFESPNNIIIFSLDKNYCYTSFTKFHRETIKAIWGVEIRQGMNLLEIISNPTDREKAKKNFDRALKGENFIQTEEYGEVNLHRNFYDDYYFPIKNPDSEIIGVSVFVIDATKQKKSEIELHEAKEKAEQNNLINEARLRIIQFSENHSVDEILEEALNLAEFITHSKIAFFHFVHADQKTLILQNWSTETKKTFCKAKGAGEHYSIDKAGVWVDCVHLRKPVIHNNYDELPHKKGLPEGHTHIIRELAVPIIYDDNIIKAIIGVGNKSSDYNQSDVENVSLIAFMVWEIVEKKKMNDALIIAKERAEESDRLKSAFLQNISHEVRTPMNAICGFSELLLDPNLTTKEYKQFSDIVQKSISQLLSVIENTITIAHIETNQLKLNNIEFDPNKLIKELFDEFEELKSKIGKSEIELIYTAENKIQTILACDYSRLKQVFEVLLDNSFKFTEKGKIQFGYEIIENQIVFFVTDTGIGIPKEKQEIILKSFTQADENIRHYFGGVGLGLSIAVGVLKLFGGQLTINSTENVGTNISFSLPFNIAKQLLETTNKSSKNLENKNILIAEDEENNFRYIEELLFDTKIKIFHAKNGKEAIEVFINHKIDLILMDIKMPIMDGFEATREIRKINKTVPIIAQTAFSYKREECINSGFTDYITKPFKTNQLIQIITKNLG